MSTIQIVLLVLAIAVVIVIVALLTGAMLRRRNLKEKFGPEYDRLVADRNNRGAAERELRGRERRHDELHLRPIAPESRRRYADAWEDIQTRFVDAPNEAVGAADRLVTLLVAERGYPVGNYDEQLAQLSVDHARTLGHYRDAHAINLRNERGEASTEQLREALVHYRALFAEVLADAAQPQARSGDTDQWSADRAGRDRHRMGPAGGM